MKRCLHVQCWASDNCPHDWPPWSRHILDGKEIAERMLDALRPAVKHVARLHALATQWERGVDPSEWIEYVPESQRD